VLKTFPKGGIHVDENKISASKKINILPVPDKVYIPVSQHLGAPSKILVNKGDKVKVGQLIAEKDGFISSNVHSSVSGTVEKIDLITDASGFKRNAVIIQVEGDEWIDNIDRSNDIKKEISLSPEEIINKITQAGIVGMGGATFPSHVKLMANNKKIDCLIINGVECEPYLTADHNLMLEKSEEIVIGIEIIKKALKIDKAFIGIEANKPDAIIKLSSIAQKFQGITVQPLKIKYPQGGEKQLIKAITKKEVPSGGLPIDIGIVVFNVGTTFAIYEAVQKNKPLIERVITVTGKYLSNPGDFWVRIGTPVIKLIEAAGGIPENTGKIIFGGPMMGKAIAGTDVPVIKGSSGVLLLEEKETRRKEILNCIRCAKCVSVCPMGLEPYLLMSLIQKEMYEKSQNNGILDCMECGCCSYTCPANRPLLDYIRLGKNNIRKLAKKN